jgi:hypothetical protein
MERRAISFALIFMAGSALGQAAPSKGFLTTAEQATALQAIREYALSYTRNLPDYTCTQITRQTVSREEFGRIPRQMTDLIEEQLSFVDNKEIRKVARINGIPASPDGPDQLRGTSSRGEFGNLLNVIFEPATGADIRFDRLSTLNRRRVYVFAFRVPQSSGYMLTESKRRIQVPFQGFVYADYQSRAVVRIDMKCVDIPAGSEYIGAGLTLDYKPATVAGHEFILPARYLLHFQMVMGFETNDADYETGAVVRIEMKCIDIPANSEYRALELTLDYRPEKVAVQEYILPSHFALYYRMANTETTSDAAYTIYRRFSSNTSIQFDGGRE